MENNRTLRDHVVKLLQGGDAHADFETVIKGIPVKLRGKRPKGAAHSAWEILEHLRIAQWDILEFTRNPKHVSPEWPSGYWPKQAAPGKGESWNKTVEQFRADLKAMQQLVADEANDLLSRIPRADGQTILREALVLADHNAYHLGELVLLRRLLGAWK